VVLVQQDHHDQTEETPSNEHSHKQP
jgi:hypothetical protein